VDGSGAWSRTGRGRIKPFGLPLDPAALVDVKPSTIAWFFVLSGFPDRQLNYRPPGKESDAAEDDEASSVLV